MSQLHRSGSDSISDKPAYPHFNITLGPYISLAADVCEIKSTVFPNLGSMTQSNISGWLYSSMQKKNGEKAQALEVSISYETKPEVNLGSPSTPLLEIRKQAVMDATASHTFISPNALPGQRLARISKWVAWKSGNIYRRPKPNTICLGSSGLPSMKRSGRKE
jgi:hypothetical protein